MNKTITKQVTAVLLIILLAFLFLSCKSQNKEVLSEDVKHEYKVSNDVVESDYNTSELLKHNEFKNDITDDYDIKRIEFEFDSSRPIDPTTGTPPLKKRTETNITKKTQDKSVKSESENLKIESESKVIDNTILSGTIDSQSSSVIEQNTQKESDIFLKWTGGITLFLLVSGFVAYIVYRKVKKN